MTRRSKHTIDSIREWIDTLRAQDQVYKTDVDLLKNSLRSAFEADWDLVKRTKYLDIEHANRSESDTSLYFESPFEIRHWYGKKFSNFLEDLPHSDFKDATVSHRNRWRPVYFALEELRARQVKGRKPVEKKVVATRTQYRAICPCCFRQQAVKGDHMVAHGYTLDYGFQNGNCRGVGQAHFGTTEGVQFTQDLIRELGADAERTKETLAKAKAREIKPRDRRSMKPIEDPTDSQWRAFEYEIEAQIRNIEYTAGVLQGKVDSWAFAEPVEVEVEVTE